MLADVLEDTEDPEYKEKVAKCFEMRVERLKKRQIR